MVNNNNIMKKKTILLVLGTLVIVSVVFPSFLGYVVGFVEGFFGM